MSGAKRVACPRCRGRGGRVQRYGTGTCPRCNGAGSIRGTINPARDLVVMLLVLAVVVAVLASGRLS